MKTLTKETARSLAKVISSRLSTFHSDDLVAILGVGRESSNEEAVESWLISRFAEIDISHVDTIMEHASEVLIQHLNDLRMEVAGGYISELPLPQVFVQSKLITDQELRCIARAIYFLVIGEGAKSYLDSLIYLVVGGEGNAIDRIAAWISTQGMVYTYFPSELTLPMAQRLMEELNCTDKLF
ncbi:MAG: hypothetical protein KKF24_11780 [Gammaproteobacteria bacterium]|nr:hypothetical protein [Gammaproteobacteria bacterium]MBU1833361.1 hypothetical protein [Gammaproteobacteria bacterium]